jgi:hypothetical protein
MIVVADTSPINYLLLINEIDILPKMYVSLIPSFDLSTQFHTRIKPIDPRTIPSNASRLPPISFHSAPPEANVNTSVLRIRRSRVRRLFPADPTFHFSTFKL